MNPSQSVNAMSGEYLRTMCMRCFNISMCNAVKKRPRRSAVKLIDFGSSCLRIKKSYIYIQSRWTG